MTTPDLELTYEELAKRAQHFLSERPAVVRGTGATIPHGLPSMQELANRLLAAITRTVSSPRAAPEVHHRRSHTLQRYQRLHCICSLYLTKRTNS